MTPLSALMPAFGQGLASASAARDPRALATIDAVEKRVALRDLMGAGLGLFDAFKGDPRRFDSAMRAMDVHPVVAEHMRRQVPFEINPVAEGLPALAATALTYGSGAPAMPSLGAGVGHYTGAGLADILARHLMGTDMDRGALTAARTIGGLAGQYLGQSALEDPDERP